MALTGWIGSRRQQRTIAWGFADQALSSMTNFGLSLLAGRLLGPSGLGKVFLAFSVYLIVLVLQRALVTETLLAITSALDKERRARTAGLGLTVSMLAGLVATAVVLILVLVVPGSGRTGLLLIAPWLVVLLVQDFWRNLLFRERRPSAAAANDGVWFLAMAAAVPVAWFFKSGWAVVTVWGVGAFGGAVVGLMQTRLRPAPLRDAWAWWWKEAWPFGRWNAAAGVVVNIGASAGAFILAAILGASALGGYRAAQSLFAPLSLIGPSIALPGLPAVARAYAGGYRQARDLAMRLSAIAVAATLAFFAVLFLGGWRLLPILFGGAFSRYKDLISPIALSQVFAAAGVGFPLVIKVQQRGQFLLLSRLAATLIGIAIMAVSAGMYGLIGAAWGSAAGALLSTLAIAPGALREPKSMPPSIPSREATVTTEAAID